MKKISIIVVLITLLSSATCFADWHRNEHRDFDRHEHRDFDRRPSLSIGLFLPVPFFSAYPSCENVCREEIVPVCRYDRWGDRWCHDERTVECRRVCY